MSLQLWLYWLPSVALVVLGAAHMRRSMSALLGVLAMVYWVIAALATQPELWSGSRVWLVGLGAILLPIFRYFIVRISEIAKETEVPQSDHEKNGSPKPTDPAYVEATSRIPEQFSEWLDTHRDLADPWPDFGEFVRSTLLACCGASQIKAYRLLSADDTTFFPLHETAPMDQDFPLVRAGILGQVSASGQSHYATDSGGHAPKVAPESDTDPCVWCFAVHFRSDSIGVIQIGELTASSLEARSHLQLVEGVIALCWSSLTEACRSRLADHTDSVAGVLTPDAFLDIAGRSVKEAYASNEPVAVVSFNVEGLRRLTDRGEWEAAKDSVARVSEILKERIRDDDSAGFFDGSRFVVLLRRVDEELAGLIVRKIHRCVAAKFSEMEEFGSQLELRCGLATSRSENVTLRSMIAQASESCASARKQGICLAVNVGAPENAGVS